MRTRIMDSWRDISMHVCGIVGKRPCATSTHILEFRLGGVHARVGSVRRGLRITSISYSRQLGLQDCIANQWKMNDLTNCCSYGSTVSSMHVYEVRPRKDKRGVDLISDGLPFGTTDIVSGRYRSVNKFDAAKATQAGAS